MAEAVPPTPPPADLDLKTTTYELVDRTAVVTLNRPHRGNAWTGRMHAEYRLLLARAEADPQVRVIVVTGAGSAFCVGADSQALEGHADRGGYDAGLRGDEARPGYGVRPEFDHPFAYHFGLAKPVLAAINGPAAGIGFVLACFCDLRLARPGVKLTTAHGKLNLPAEAGLSWLLPRLIGVSRAMEVLLTSRILLTEEAADFGLVNRLTGDDVLGETLAFAAELAAGNSARSLTETRRQVYGDLHGDVGRSVRESHQLIDEMMGEPDFRRGVEALLRKQPPGF